jgi:hypothetical protein
MTPASRCWSMVASVLLTKSCRRFVWRMMTPSDADRPSMIRIGCRLLQRFGDIRLMKEHTKRPRRGRRVAHEPLVADQVQGVAAVGPVEFRVRSVFIE